MEYAEIIRSIHKKCKAFHRLFLWNRQYVKKRAAQPEPYCPFSQGNIHFLMNIGYPATSPAKKPRRVPLSAESGRESNHFFAGFAGEKIHLAERACGRSPCDERSAIPHFWNGQRALPAARLPREINLGRPQDPPGPFQKSYLKEALRFSRKAPRPSSALGFMRASAWASVSSSSSWAKVVSWALFIRALEAE